MVRGTRKQVYARLEGQFTSDPAKNIRIKHYVMLIQFRQAQQGGLRITVEACHAVPFMRFLILTPEATPNEGVPENSLSLRAGVLGRRYYVGW